jgi:hypothetical protein
MALSSLSNRWIGGRNTIPRARKFGGGTVRIQKMGGARGWVGGKNRQKMDIFAQKCNFLAQKCHF